MMDATYWEWTCRTLADGKPGVAASGGRGTLGEALADGFREAAYYIAACGYQARLSVREHCSECHNVGTVRRQGRRVNRRVRCPLCRGRAPAGQIPEFPVTLPAGLGERAA